VRLPGSKGNSDHRGSAAFAVAVAAHLAAAFAVAVHPLRGSEVASVSALPAPRGPETELVDVALEEVSSVQASAAFAPAKEPSAPAAAVGAGAIASRSAERSLPASEKEAASPAPAAPDGEGWSFRPTQVELGLPQTALALDREEAPSASSPAPLSTTGGLAEGLHARDVDRGLGRGGPVLSAVEDAARSAEAPAFGVATFTVRIDRGGRIDVDVLDASSDRTAWEGLGPAIAEHLAKKPVKLPASSGGLRVTVRIEASEQFPGGARPPPPEKQGVIVKATPPKVTETKTSIDIQLPTFAAGYQGRKCSGGVVIHPGGISAGGGCEVGAAMRVVAARIVSENLL
jgi:hypothetical protein